MDAEAAIESSSRLQPTLSTATLNTKEDVAKEIQEWMKRTEIDQDGKNSYENAIEYIELKLKRPLSCLESTWFARQYVKTVLQFWLEKSLEKAFKHLDNEENDISKYMSTVLEQLDSIHSFGDILSSLNDVTSLKQWCDGECRYLQLILEQEDLFASTSRFTNLVNCYFKEFKTSCIDKVFSRCLSDIVNDKTNGKKHEKFIARLNEFLSNVNEDKNLQDILKKEEFFVNYVTGRDLVKKLLEMFNCVEDESSRIPEWLQTFLCIEKSLSENEWTSKLQVLTKVTCKRFLLPVNEIEFKEEDGKEIISIKGVAIFVSKMIEKMNRLKDDYPDIEEIKIVGLKSVHIDCDLDNEIWHGINIAIVTDKLIVDDISNDDSAPYLRGVCWNVSGKHAEEQKMGEFRKPGESGGNVHVVCNEIINGQKWTIVSDGGDGGAAYKWTKQEFEELLPSGRVRGTNRQEGKKTVLETLQEILPRENRTRDAEINPEDNFLIEGKSNDGSKITAILYREINEQETLISVTRGNAGHGGYGGDITVECVGNRIEVNQTSAIPFTDKVNTGRKPLTAIRMGVFEASGSDGKIGKVTCDVAYIHNSSTNSRGDFYGFEEDRKIEIQLDLERKSKEDDSTKYVKYKAVQAGRTHIEMFAKVSMINCLLTDVPINLVNALKKKAVIRQSLVQHFNQIDERRQLTESIQKKLSHPMEHRSISIDEILKEMKIKANQHHQLMTQCQQQQFDKIDQKQYVKPKIDSSRSPAKPKITGRRPVCNPVVRSNCLDELPTEDGNDSLLHCLFGQLNSEGKYMCKNINKFRKLLAKHSRQESQNGTMGTAELEMLAEILEIKIHVYEYHGSSSFRYKKTVDPKNVDNNEYFILYESNGRWKKLSPNHNLKFFCKEFLLVEDDQNYNPTYFEQLKSWINEKAEVIFSIEKLNPNNKTPDKLSQLLLNRLNNDSNDVEKIQKLTSAISSLVEWVEYYNTRNVSPFFYLAIVESYEPGEWTREFLQLEIEDRLEKPWEHEEERDKWKKFICENLSSHGRALPLLTKIATKTESNDILFALDFKKLLRMLTVLEEEKFDFTEGDVGQISVINFFYKQSSKFWETKVDDWLEVNEQLTKQNKAEYVNILQELEYKNEKEFLQNLPNDEERIEFIRRNTFLPEDNSKSEPKSVGVIIDEIKKNDHKNEHEKGLKRLVNENMITVSKAVKEELQNGIETIAEKLLKEQPENKKLEIFLKKNGTVQENTFLKRFSSKVKKEKTFYELLSEMHKKANEQLPDGHLVNALRIFFLPDFNFVDVPSCFETFVLNARNIFSLLSNPNVISILPNLKVPPNSPNENVFSSPLSNPNLIPSLLYNPDIISLLNDQNIIPSLKSDPKVILHLACNPIISSFMQSNPDLRSIVSNSNIFSSILSNQNLLSSILSNSYIESIISKSNISSLNHPKVTFLLSNPQKFSLGSLEWGISMLKMFICFFDYAVELLTGYKLRDTQKIAILYLMDDTKHAKNERKKFAEVWTGEGKSLIVAGVAIAFAYTMKLQKPWPHKVDIITSNDHLAIRDSSLSVAQGGLKEIYEFFNITVANNCSKSADERKKAYNMDVVYGTLANFQRDYLLDEFYHRNMRGDGPMVNAIIDEVDCMLLDRGNNMLYLSHDIPGMEMLESLYVFIWEKICDTSAERIKSEILYDIYGKIKEEDLKNIDASLEQKDSERTAIWEHLIERKIIDRQGQLLINEVSEITKQKFDDMSRNVALEEEALNSKIIEFLCRVTKRERRIRIPSHLLDFVDRHLDTWLDNARRALELKQDEDYVIDHDRSDTSPDLNPQVIIIDPDTGTDQSSSQWDGGLHQFLQLKEGCKLTLQSLKAVFISNATYIKKYDNIAGVSGTLGSQPEQDFLKKKYKCEFMTIPTASPRRFSLKPPKILKTKESWWKAITQETRTIIQENRSIVIFCRSIKEVYQVHKHLKSETRDLRDNNKRIHRYTRDYEKFQFENSELDAGNVIVATNLAGRGTDIKISETLKANGGLHICLTYFPDNERVEGQAMGRAARKGEPGSGILILCEEQTDQAEDSGTSEEWGAEKMFFMKEVREWKERQRISRLENNFKHIEWLERFFEEYTTDFSEKKMKEKFKEIRYLKGNHTVQLPVDDVLLKLIHGSALDKWALFLDETDYDFKCFDLKRFKFEIDLKDLNNDIFKWMTPARRVSFAKHLAMKKSEQIDSEGKIIEILNELIDSPDHFFYPAAFYYLAFILLAQIKKEGEEKEKRNENLEKTESALIRTLRQTETILNGHIKMQESFISIHQSDRNPGQILSFCAVNGYREQKENTRKILQYFLDSTRRIRSLLIRLGAISDIREDGSAPVMKDREINSKEEVDNITQCDKERKCIIPTTPEFVLLDCIEQDMKSESNNNFSDELYVFKLVGFDRVIKEESGTGH